MDDGQLHQLMEAQEGYGAIEDDDHLGADALLRSVPVDVRIVTVLPYWYMEVRRLTAQYWNGCTWAPYIMDGEVRGLMTFFSWRELKEQKKLRFTLAHGTMVGDFKNAGEFSATGWRVLPEPVVGVARGVWNKKET